MTTQTLPTIAAGAHATKSIATCAHLLALAGLEELLQGEGQYTLFAPTDAAFDALPPEARAALENDPVRLRATLEYHIVCADRDLSQLRNAKVPTLEGTLLTASVTDDGVRLDHANVCGRSLRCANGVIHQIDAVLFPGFKPLASPMARQESAWSGRRRASRTTTGSHASAAAEALFESPATPPADSTT